MTPRYRCNQVFNVKIQLIIKFMNEKPKLKVVSVETQQQKEARLEKNWEKIYEKAKSFAEIHKMTPKDVLHFYALEMIEDASEMDDDTDLINKLKRLSSPQLDNSFWKRTDLKIKLEKAEKAAITDKLTGLYNRREFDTRLEEMIGNYRTKLIPFSVILLDIDDFKGINDTFGHKAGDLVIQKVAEVINSSVKSQDSATRYGGEEFGVIIEGNPDVNELDEIVNKVITRINKAISEINLGELVNRPEVTEKISISAGFAEYDPSAEVGVTESADRALYASKKAKGSYKGRYAKY